MAFWKKLSKKTSFEKSNSPLIEFFNRLQKTPTATSLTSKQHEKIVKHMQRFILLAAVTHRRLGRQLRAVPPFKQLVTNEAWFDEQGPSQLGRFNCLWVHPVVVEALQTVQEPAGDSGRPDSVELLPTLSREQAGEHLLEPAEWH